MQLFLHLFFYWHLLGCNAPISPEGGSNVLKCHLIIIKEEEHARPHWMLQKAETRKVKGDDSGQKSVKQLKNKNEVFKMSSGKASISMSCTCHSYTLLWLQKGASRWGEQQEKDEESVFYQNKGRQTKTHKYKHKLVKVGHTLISTTFTLKLC